ncbi:MAG: class I SAM-dependent RNA methyltransferase [Acidimicrobiia bacterium]
MASPRSPQRPDRGEAQLASSDDLEVTVERVVAGGDGLAHDPEGRVVFVPGALPGERARVRVVAEKKSFARAHLVAVVEAAPERVAPPCPRVADGCGGCTWQHVDAEAQRRLKAGIVADALRRIGRVGPPPIGLGPALPAFGFRTTVRCLIEGGRAAFRHHRGHDPVVAGRCLVAHPLIDELVADGRFDGCTEVTLRCGAATGDRLVVAEPGAAGVRVPADVVVVAGGSADHATFHDVVAGRRWRISAGSFFQTRTDGAEALVGAVRAAVGAALTAQPTVVDLYAGVGLFAGTLGPALGAGRVVAVESNPAAAADAAHNLADLDATVVAADVRRWRPVRADVVVADPPRSGLGAAGADIVAATGAGRVVLVSCDPASLGRDTALLAQRGFDLVGVSLVDLFPHTAHVETVASYAARARPADRASASSPGGDGRAAQPHGMSGRSSGAGPHSVPAVST